MKKKPIYPFVVAATLAVFMLSSMGTACAQSPILFLKLDGVEGESTHAVHRNAIAVLACGFDAGSDIEDLLSTTPAVSRIAPLKIVKNVDKASPILFLRCLEETVSANATISFRKLSNSFDFFVITLKNVKVTNYKLDGIEGDSPVESIVLSYDEIEVKYTLSDARGRAAASIAKKFRLQ